jgi:hypothetical protein
MVSIAHPRDRHPHRVHTSIIKDFEMRRKAHSPPLRASRRFEQYGMQGRRRQGRPISKAAGQPPRRR